MARQLSTALSELILCIFCFTISYKIYNQNKIVCGAIAASGSAAFFGIFRYGLSNSRVGVYRWHHVASKIAFVFTPALFASVYVAPIHTIGSIVFLVAPAIVTFVLSEVDPDNQEVFMTILSGLSLITIIYVSFLQNIISGILGGLLMLLGSIIAQTDGSFLGIKRVDLFHFALIPAFYFMANGVVNV